MKITIKLIPVVFVILFSSICDAQTPAQWLAMQQRELKNKPYIIEGKVIDQSIIRGSLCNIVQIKKIYRGNEKLKFGTIRVILTYNTGDADAPPGLNKNSTYVIFGVSIDSNSFKTIVADNIYTLHTNDWVTFTETGATWGWRQTSNYPTVDSLYSFFKANGLTVQEEQK